MLVLKARLDTSFFYSSQKPKMNSNKNSKDVPQSVVGRKNGYENAAPELVRAGTGFTLTELLVVIAIIAVLAVLGFPLATKMKAKSQAATCMSNLRQLTTSAFLYSTDNNGNLPQPDESGGVMAWPDTLAPYIGEERPFETELSVKTCPTQYAIFAQSRTFGLNRQLTGKRQGSAEGPTKVIVISRAGGQSTQPSTIPIFMDGVNIAKGNWRIHRSWGDNEFNEKNYPHDGACNMSFMDGHVEATRHNVGIWANDQPKFDDGKPAF